MWELQSNVFVRQGSIEELRSDEDEYLEVSLFDLLKAFASVLESQSTVEQEEIIFDEILVSDRIEHITEMLKEREHIIFTEIFSPRPNRPEVVATFLAILEMAKMKMITISQHRVFGEIRLTRKFTLEQIG